MDSQIEKAIEIAWNSSANPTLKSQALEFIDQLRCNPNSWQDCLSLFVRNPRAHEVVRHYCLDLINHAVQNCSNPGNLELIRSTLLSHVSNNYTGTPSMEFMESSLIQNKLSQTLTMLFERMYANTWSSFFRDFRSLADGGQPQCLGLSNIQSTTLYFKILESIHNQIADKIIVRSNDEAKLHADLRDKIRSCDVEDIARSWQILLLKWQDVDSNLIVLCLNSLGNWAQWIPITLIVNEATMSALYNIVGQHLSVDRSKATQFGQENVDVPKIRDAALDTLTKIVTKKMSNGEKLDLINYLQLENLVNTLINSASLSNSGKTPRAEYDVELAESVARLINATVLDLAKITEVSGSSENKELQVRSSEALIQFLPGLLFIFSHDYDEVCNCVLPAFTEALTLFRKLARSPDNLPARFNDWLMPMLNSILLKMKYDDNFVWGGTGGDESDDGGGDEFEALRKKLLTLQKIICEIRETEYIDTLSNMIAGSLLRAERQDGELKWQELELALYELFNLGDTVGRTGIYNKNNEAGSVVGSRIIYLVCKMTEANLARFAHPSVHMLFMEISSRYVKVYEVEQYLIPRGLTNYVQFAHSEQMQVKLRAWYLLMRFVKTLRNALSEVCESVIQSISDLLTIKASAEEGCMREGKNDACFKLNDEQQSTSDTVFRGQLYLYEAIGNMVAGNGVPINKKVMLIQNVVSPIFRDMEMSISRGKNGDAQAIVQVHHDIMVLGTICHGFSDGGGIKALDEEGLKCIRETFYPCLEAVAFALESMGTYMLIRAAARYSLARFLRTIGDGVLAQLPRWINGCILVQANREELGLVLRLLEQVIFEFGQKVAGILNNVFMSVLGKVLEGIEMSDGISSGTDERLEIMDLTREFLQFLMITIQHGFGWILFSEDNRGIFEQVMTACQSKAGEVDDIGNACLTFKLINKMLNVFGEGDMHQVTVDNGGTIDKAAKELQDNGYRVHDKPKVAQLEAEKSEVHKIPGFTDFAVRKFAGLAWIIPMDKRFEVKDGLTKELTEEIVIMQVNFLAKAGSEYLTHLAHEFSEMGLSKEEAQNYAEWLSGHNVVSSIKSMGNSGNGNSSVNNLGKERSRSEIEEMGRFFFQFIKRVRENGIRRLKMT